VPSYSPVYSQGFIYYTEEAPNTTFDVPAGFTAVVRQWSCYLEAGGVVAQISGANAPGAPYTVFDTQEAAGLVQQLQGHGHWVVPGGGSILLYSPSLGSGVSAYVGGYLLRNTLT
jgi:hypothetical protein